MDHAQEDRAPSALEAGAPGAEPGPPDDRDLGPGADGDIRIPRPRP